MNENWGGARKGGGRPKKANKRVTLSVRIDPDVSEWIKKQEESAGQVIESLCKVKMNLQEDLLNTDDDCES
jgi:hypothetical protein